MANKQLVDYVVEQMSHKTDLNQVRTILTNQGWAGSDVEEAIMEAYAKKKKHNHQKHGTNFTAIAVSLVVIVVLGIALLMTVYSNEGGVDEPITAPTIVPEVSVPAELSGWELCSLVADSVEKDACYQEINEENVEFNCYQIADSVEKNFCFRAKEVVLLKQM